MHKNTRPYEILVRIHPDGTSAAHVKECEDIIDDDGVTVVHSKELDPKPLSLAGPEFDALIPALDQAVLKQNAALIVDLEKATAKAAALEKRAQSYEQQNAALSSKRDALQSQRDSLLGQLARLEGEAATLREAIKAAEVQPEAG